MSRSLEGLSFYKLLEPLSFMPFMLCRMMASAHDLIQGTLKNNCITPEVADFHSRVIKGAGIDDYSAFPDGRFTLLFIHSRKL